MPRHHGPVLVDTNVILECWRIGAWRALTGAYTVETVEDCVIETQTGFQRRRTEQQVDEAALRASLGAPAHAVTDNDLAVVAVQLWDITLDVGERSLWAHALTRNDAWVLCGPDKASMRFGVRLGFRERLAALESLLDDAGYRAKRALKTAYTRKWLDGTLGELVVIERHKRK
jgi:hypothetical protein